MLKCGFAQVDITPVPGEVILDGYGFRTTPAEGVFDPIYGKICAFICGEQRFLLASLDVCGMCDELAYRLRATVAIACGLSAQQVAVCATHTHAAPACGVLADLPINYIYWDDVAVKLSQAAVEAFASAVAGEFRFAVGGALTSSVNRRGKESIDRSVRVGGFFGTDGTPIGLLVSAACHAVIHTEACISSDYPGVMYAALQEQYPDVPVLFLQGRGADINPCFASPCSTEEGCRQLGGELAQAVLAAIATMQNDRTQPTSDMVSFSQTVRVPMEYPRVEDMEADNSYLLGEAARAENVEQARPVLRELYWRTRAIRRMQNGESPDLQLPIQVLRLSNKATFVFLPFEILTATGNAVEQMLREQGLAPQECFVIGYANGTNGYLAPLQDFDDGGYEISGAAHWYDLPHCTKQSEPAVLAAVRDLLERSVRKTE